MKVRFRMTDDCLLQFEAIAASSTAGRMSMARLEAFRRFIEQTEDWFDVLAELGHLKPFVESKTEFTLSYNNLPYFLHVSLEGGEVVATGIGQKWSTADFSGGPSSTPEWEIGS